MYSASMTFKLLWKNLSFFLFRPFTEPEEQKLRKSFCLRKTRNQNQVLSSFVPAGATYRFSGKWNPAGQDTKPWNDTLKAPTEIREKNVQPWSSFYACCVIRLHNKIQKRARETFSRASGRRCNVERSLLWFWYDVVFGKCFNFPYNHCNYGNFPSNAPSLHIKTIKVHHRLRAFVKASRKIHQIFIATAAFKAEPIINNSTCKLSNLERPVMKLRLEP